MNWKALLHGIVGAAIGGAATTVTSVLSDPLHVDFHHLGPVAGAGAIIGIAALFRQSPLSPSPPTDTNNAPTQPPNFPSSR